MNKIGILPAFTGVSATQALELLFTRKMPEFVQDRLTNSKRC
jgi:hypothetical protein